MMGLWAGLAVLIGLILPLQAAINNQLKFGLGGSTLLAALVSFLVGSICLFVISMLTGQKLQNLAGVARVEWWMLLGGCMGALFVFGTTFLAPRMGVAAMISLIIAGQVCASLLLDRLGVLDLPVRELGGWRVLGAVLVMVGVGLVNFGDRLS